MRERQFETGSINSAVQERESSQGNRARPLLMMVEDDAHDRAIYGDILCYNGYDVVMASTVREALQRVESYEPDLVMLDMGLPDGTGLDVCVEIRRRSDRQIPIIALSAFPQSRMEASAANAGCSIYVEKPASPVDVLHHIEGLIGRAPLPGEGSPPTIIPTADS